MKSILFLFSLLISYISGELLYSVACDPKCSFYSIDSKNGNVKKLYEIGEFIPTYVRPNVITSDSFSERIFWSFPQAPNGTIWAYNPSLNNTITFENFPKGVITMQGDNRGNVLVVSNPNDASLSNLNIQSKKSSKIVDLSSQIGGHEWCSTLDIEKEIFYIAGEDLTAKNGNITAVDIKTRTLSESPYQRWVTPGMGFYPSLGIVLIAIEQQSQKTLFTHYDFNSPHLDILFNIGHLVERAFLTISEKNGKAYFFVVPNILYTFDLEDKKLLNTVELNQIFATNLVGITSL